MDENFDRLKENLKAVETILKQRCEEVDRLKEDVGELKSQPDRSGDVNNLKGALSDLTRALEVSHEKFVHLENTGVVDLLKARGF